MAASIRSFMLYSFSFILLYIVAWILDLSSLVYLFYKEIFGTAPAPGGTFDIMGNVWEWMENPGYFRGGSFVIPWS